MKNYPLIKNKENIQSQRKNELSSKVLQKHRKFYLSPIKSENSSSTEKLLAEASEYTSHESTFQEINKFQVRARNLSINKNPLKEEVPEQIDNALKENAFANTWENKILSQNQIIQKDIHTKFEESIENNRKMNKDEYIKLDQYYDSNDYNKICIASLLEKLFYKSITLLVCFVTNSLMLNISLIYLVNWIVNNQVLSALNFMTIYMVFITFVLFYPLYENLTILGATAYKLNSLEKLNRLFLKTQGLGLLLNFIFILFSSFYLDVILSYIGFDESSIALSYNYFKALIPVIIIDTMLMLNLIFMNILNKKAAIYAINFIRLSLHFLIAYLLIIYLNVGEKGLAYSILITDVIAFLLSIAYFFIVEIEHKNRKIMKFQFIIFKGKWYKGLKIYMKQTLLRLVSLASLSFSDQILNFFAKKLIIDNNDFYVYTIVYQHFYIYLMMQCVLGISCSTILNNLVVKIKDTSLLYLIPILQKAILNILLIFSIIILTIYFAAYITVDYISQFYFSDNMGKSQFSYNFSFLLLVCYFNSLLFCMHEILFGIKQSFYSFLVNVISGYLIKFSLAIYFISTLNMNLKGIYFSILISSLTGILICGIIIFYTDYEKLCYKLNNESSSDDEMFITIINNEDNYNKNQLAENLL